MADLVKLLIATAEKGERLRGQLQAPGDESAALDSAATGQGLYYACCDQAPTLGELAQMIAHAAGRRRAIVLPLPATVTWSVAAVLELLAHVSRRPAALNLDKAREATAGCWTCSARKAAEQLGFVPDMPLAKRILETVRWYREVGWL